MDVIRSAAAQATRILLVWAVVAQVLSTLSVWFFISTRDPTVLLFGALWGGGALGVVGLLPTAIALHKALRDDYQGAGIWALVGGIVAFVSLPAVVAGFLSLLSPEAREAPSPGPSAAVGGGPPPPRDDTA